MGFQPSEVQCSNYKLSRSSPWEASLRRSARKTKCTATCGIIQKRARSGSRGPQVFSSLYATLLLLENLASSSRWCCETTGKVDLVTDVPHTNLEISSAARAQTTSITMKRNKANSTRALRITTPTNSTIHDSTHARGMTAITFNVALHIYGPRKCRQIFPPPTLSGGKGPQ